jgi:hypothetical protein
VLMRFSFFKKQPCTYRSSSRLSSIYGDVQRIILPEIGKRIPYLGEMEMGCAEIFRV